MVRKLVIYISLIAVFLLLFFAAWFYSQITGSLAQLDGQQTVWGLKHKTIIDRDIQGVVTIKATNRFDAAVALGFVHAQERFFQMDLSRRNSAGELASLFGSVALPHDKNIRKHRFRERASLLLTQLPSEQQQLLKAYTQGVNQGLSSLASPPFEYLLLQQEPVEWQEEDTLLTIFSMYLSLQQQNIDRELTLGTLNQIVTPEVYQFLTPKGGQWDAAVDGSQFKPSPIPSSLWHISETSTVKTHGLNAKNIIGYDAVIGSNSWAIANSLTPYQSAMLANDMHLNIAVPNTWFRAQLNYDNDQGEQITVTGVTLPGSPSIIVGSNQHIAWGFTNSYIDTSDIIVLTSSADQQQYLTHEGFKPFTLHQQMIAVSNAPAEKITIKETQWGPVIGQDSQGNLLALRWIAYDKQAINLSILALEQAKNVQQAVDIAHSSYIPTQNFIVADNSGQIAWTLMGAVPQRNQPFGDKPENWANNQYQWVGYLASDQIPSLINPEHQRLWTANARVMGGKTFEKLGDGGYSLGARAQQIRDDLFAVEQFNEESMLGIALDDRALFLSQWKQLIEQLITPEIVQQYPKLHDLQQLIIKNQDFRASKTSALYTVVRQYRLAVRHAVFAELNTALKSRQPLADISKISSRLDIPLWQLIQHQPQQFIPNNAKSWSEFLAKQLVVVVDELTERFGSLNKAAWGKMNQSQIQHPLSRAIPWLAAWLDMPKDALAGDHFMPRVQGQAFGASERMVVSPGHEEHGIFHMPTGQSGHFMSPFYRAGHDDWVQGKPSPFLPGKTSYTLTLLSY